MTTQLGYDPADPSSIERYAQRLLYKSLRQVLGDEIQQSYTGKGKLGQFIESEFFGYSPNSDSRPDFEEAGVELKTCPLVASLKYGFVSKERLVFSSIDFNEVINESFETSKFWNKDRLLLLMFFIYQTGISELDFIFRIIRLWNFPERDVKIIKDDWERIVQKIRDGKAHEISEGDTLYLGACTKGKDSNSLRTQPCSDQMAMRRAFSLKQKYLNFILQQSLAYESDKPQPLTEQPVLVAGENAYPLEKIATESTVEKPIEFEPVVKDTNIYRPGQSFEGLVVERFVPFYGMSEAELMRVLNLPHTQAKSRFYIIAKAILGISGSKIEEFEKGGVLLKTIRLEHTGALKESMSFAQIQFEEIIEEEWEDSYWFETLSKRFFFVIFQKDDRGELRLRKVMFWAMPATDLKVAKEFWEDTRDKIRNDDFDHFIRLSDDVICHVRPKGADSRDLMRTPSGRMERKKCYWLNASYIKKVIHQA